MHYHKNMSINNSKNDQFTKIIDDDTTEILIFITIVLIYPVVGLFGVVTNIINIAVFVKQGFKDTVSVTLLGLAVADLCSLIALLLLSFFYNPLLLNSNVSFNPSEISYLLAGMPRVCSTRILSWITAFITFERCLCVLMPLKIKTLITPPRATLVIFVIYISMMASLVPVYYTTRLGWKLHPDQNRTLLGLIFIENRTLIDRFTFALGSFFTICSFLCVLACTLILVVSLKRKMKWRDETAHASESSRKKDTKVVKMVVVISTIFIVTFLPINVVQLVMSAEPEFSKGGKLSNIFHISWAFAYIFEAISSSVNIFVYLKMSSKYKATITNICPLWQGPCKASAKPGGK